MRVVSNSMRKVNPVCSSWYTKSLLSAENVVKRALEVLLVKFDKDVMAVLLSSLRGKTSEVTVAMNWGHITAARDKCILLGLANWHASVVRRA